MHREKEVPAPAKAAKASTEVVWGIAAYALCSASLLVINKVAVSAIPSASFVLICQFAASVAAVLALSGFGLLEKVSAYLLRQQLLQSCSPTFQLMLYHMLYRCRLGGSLRTGGAFAVEQDSPLHGNFPSLLRVPLDERQGARIR